MSTGNDDHASPEEQDQTPALFDAGTPQLPERVASGNVVPKLSDIVLTPEDEAKAAERWPDASEKKRQLYMKQSILATLRHQLPAQDGSGRRMFGGPQPGAGRKKAELGNTLVDEANKRHDEIMNALFAPLSPGNPVMDRHKAANNILREVRKDREADMRADELERASKEELVKEAAAILAEMARNGDIQIGADGQIVDADVVDDAA
jgi:hypothetical protein